MGRRDFRPCIPHLRAGRRQLPPNAVWAFTKSRAPSGRGFMRGPVSRVLSWTAIYLGRALPRASSHLHRDGRAGLVSLSTVLLRIEFTAPACLHAAGELLPRLSTLTSSQSALTSVSGKSQRLSPKTAFAPLLLLSPRKRRAFVGTPFDFSPGGGSTRYISVALVRGFPLAGVTRYPCPVEPGLSSRTGFRRVRAAARPAAEYFTPPCRPKSIKLLYLPPGRDIIRR